VPFFNCLCYLLYRAQEIFRSGLDSPHLRMTVERRPISDTTTHAPQTSTPLGKCDLLSFLVKMVLFCGLLSVTYGNVVSVIVKKKQKKISRRPRCVGLELIPLQHFQPSRVKPS